jgi:hypothetical protein
VASLFGRNAKLSQVGGFLGAKFSVFAVFAQVPSASAEQFSVHDNTPCILPIQFWLKKNA